MYREGNVIVSDSVVFHVLTRGYKPGFTTAKDTTIALFEGKPVVFVDRAEGASPLVYSWYKGAVELEGKNSDTLKFASFSVNDTGSYKCIASNEYGNATGRTFILKHRPFSGAIKGVVVDSSGNKLQNAIVTLSPSDKEKSTDSAGAFEFISLSANTYTLKICLLLYHDTTLSKVAVNDSEATVLPAIAMKKIVLATFRVTYNGNGSDGGTAPVDSLQYKQGDRARVAAAGDLSRAGYVFSKWNTDKEGGKSSYSPGDSVTINKDVIFYAQWIALPTYQVTYDKNGSESGTVPIDGNSYYKGKKVTIAGNPGSLQKEGYSFSGWNTKSDGTGETYNAGAKLSMPDSALTLYVKWTTNPTYSIFYHGTTSTGGTVPATVNADSGMQVAIADSGSLYKTGHAFAGWNTKEDGSGKTYKAGDRLVMGTVDIDLYVQWTKAQYTVMYYGNGNTGGTVPPKTTHLYQTEVTVVNSDDLYKTGHSFVGWNTDPAGNGLDYEAGNKIIVENNVHLYARWLKKRYRITFLGNGDRTANVPDATEYEYGLKIDSATVVPSRESYIF
jgi:uncharacterized repeat protein (TIGR02543 family)